MEFIGSLLFVLAVALAVAMFVSQPFLRKGKKYYSGEIIAQQKRDHQRSALLAERDRTLNALHELDFDYTLGKVPQEDYQEQRAVLLHNGAEVLRKLDEMEITAGVIGSEGNEPAPVSMEERIEAAVAARRADVGRSSRPSAETAGAEGGRDKSARRDELEDLIARRKRQRGESSAGFCPRCGRPVQKSDKFCSKCGADL